MKWLNALSVKASWTLVLVMFSGLVVVIGGLGLFANHFGREAFTSLHQRDMTQISQLNSAYNQLLRARIQMNRAAELIRTPSFDRPDPLIDEAEQLLASAAEDFTRFEASHFDQEQQAIVDQLASDFQSFVNNNLSLQMMMLQDRDITGFFSGESRVDESSQRFIDSADAFFDASAQRGNALFARFEEVSSLLFWGVIAALVASLMVVSVVVWGVFKNVLRPLRAITKHFQRIAKGDLSVPVESHADNEIGQLFSELAYMQQSLRTTVNRLTVSSEQVHSNSQEMTEQNQRLARQTDTQVSALQQMAASLEQLTATVNQNAESASHVSQSTADVSHKAQQGDEVISQFIMTMEAINRHSEEIQSIIRMIESIAFQTNILALNASVEAARAGEHGRGFAVVANEVRALATRSANAASDIRKRIEASRDSVEQGSELSQQAGEHTRSIMQAARHVDTLMIQMAHASEEQRRGIEEVNQAVVQIDTTTQGTMSLVNQAAHSAEVLSREALQMREYAGQFSVDGEVADEGHDRTNEEGIEYPEWEQLSQDGSATARPGKKGPDVRWLAAS
ncbi:methyl-accepting chemotaxis protein [Vreelandella janggokensis]|uniref:methyl-accepting chemotaxis protein n=1 Tax=Vreelandella janggokensis TaxID=370767 RepID=UPI00286254B2|nr:methyl-accepting chemotaxis protein [Halomonas janggokensis]MDR5887014.1 methyl-accepting chemotaxis protein [Halomonas janggokensis]